MFQTALILLVLGVLCLAMTLCDEGLAKCLGEVTVIFLSIILMMTAV
jgi:hypothetical protein